MQKGKLREAQNGKVQGIGEIHSRSNTKQCEIKILPKKPRWFKSRPCLVIIKKEGTCIVQTNILSNKKNKVFLWNMKMEVCHIFMALNN